MSVINKQAYGVGNPIFGVQQKPIIAETDPVRQKAQLGTIWVNTAADSAYVLTAVVAGIPVWTNLAGGAGEFTSLTVNPGNLTVTTGNIVATAGSISAGANITATGNITANTGNIVATLGDIRALSGDYLGRNDSISDAPASMVLEKSRAGGIITSGDGLGILSFEGFDGAAFQPSAGIAAISTGTIGAGRMPTDMRFFTSPDAVSALQNRMTIPADGGLVINNPTTATTPYLMLGTIRWYVGAGAPGNGLAIAAGDTYVRTDPAGATSRMYIATAAGSWTNVTCAA